MKKLKIYFAGSIRGGRDKVESYKKIAEYIEKYGDILDKHIFNPQLDSKGESINACEIYERDINWIKECDILIAEVSKPSLGVGYEVAFAEKLGKEIICLCEKDIILSAMISGNKNFDLILYSTTDELKDKLSNRLS